MQAQQLIQIALLLSIFLVVFSLGLEAKPGDAVFLLRRPSLALRSLLSMHIVMVAFAVAVTQLFKLDPEIEVAILALAVSPVPPVLPRNSRKGGGDNSYSVGLLFVAVLAAFVIVPVSIDGLGRYFGVKAYMPPGKILPIVLITALVPMVSGILLSRFAPKFAARLVGPLGKGAWILLLAVALPVIIFNAGLMFSMLGNGVLAVLVAFSLVGLMVGHLLGGPDPEARTVLALATCVRHPGIALTIVAVNFPHLKSAVLAVILWHLIVGMILTTPYKTWRRKSSR